VRKAASGGSAPKEAKDVFSHSLIRFRRLLLLAVVVAGVTASAAEASAVRATAAPDVFERYAATHRSAGAPDVFERYAAAHPYGAGASTAVGTERIVDDSFRDAPVVASAAKSGDGLDWGAFGIGAGAMLGLALLVTGLGIGTLAMRNRASKLGTS
jgi:hypothetical protein